MNAVVIAPESRRQEWWEEERADVCAMTKRKTENLVTEDDAPMDNIILGKTAAVADRTVVQRLAAAGTVPVSGAG